MFAWITLISVWSAVMAIIAALNDDDNGFWRWLGMICLIVFLLDILALCIYGSAMFLQYMQAWPFNPR